MKEKQTTDDRRQTAEEFRKLPHGSIARSATNPRKQFDEAKLQELAATIREHGIIEPLLVRPFPSLELLQPDLVEKFWRLMVGGVVRETYGDHGPGAALAKKDLEKLQAARNGAEYELVAGERRWRAAALAKLPTVPALVRELTDAQVLEIQYIENLQREDLTPLEEAEGFAQLVKSGAYTADTLAAKLGKSRSHVFGRLALARVGGKVREALLAGDIDATSASLIGGIPGEKQQEECLAKADQYGMSFDDLKEHITDNYRQALTSAIFDRKDADLLKGAASCDLCPKRTGNMPEFDPATKANPNVCTDPACYKRKVGAHRRQLEARFTDKGLKVLTAAESRSAFDYRGEVDDDGPYVATHTKPEGKKKTFGELLEENPKAQAVVAFDPKQKPHILYRKADIAPLLKEQGVKVEVPKRQASFSYNSPEYKAQQAKEAAEREAKNKLGKTISERVIPQIAAAIEADPGTLKFWQFYVEALLERYHRYGKKKEDTSKLTEPQLRMIAVRWLCFGDDSLFDYNGEPSESALAACEFCQIDLKAVIAEEKAKLKEAKAETAEQPKPAKPKKK